MVVSNYFSKPHLQIFTCMCSLLNSGLSIVQNGVIPKFLNEEVMKELFEESSSQQCIVKLRNGLAKLGIYQVQFCTVCYFCYSPSTVHVYDNCKT